LLIAAPVQRWLTATLVASERLSLRAQAAEFVLSVHTQRVVVPVQSEALLVSDATAAPAQRLLSAAPVASEWLSLRAQAEALVLKV
jgi:hypothetical protein